MIMPFHLQTTKRKSDEECKLLMVLSGLDIL